MPQIDIVYEGDLHTTAVHAPSGAEIATDAPKDNQGRGESFSPTDLVAASLGTCMMTIMGIAARKRGIDINGAKVSVSKHMVSEPVRRIGKLEVSFEMPAGLTPKEREILEKAAVACPVGRSLHPEIEAPVKFHYAD
jgi:putative redox protein